MKKNHALAIATFATISFLSLACTASKNAASAEVSKIQPKFDYVPKSASGVGSSNITIALVSPVFGDANLSMNPFEDMRKSMGNDFEELLTSKGFKIRGPFNQHGEMLYNDKLNSDFVFEVEIDLNFRNIDRKLRTVTKANWGKILNPYTDETSDVYYMYEGQGTVIPGLIITASSANFSEKLWKKNITLPAVTFKYKGQAKWGNSNASLLDEIAQDNSVFNEISKLLENQYQVIFDLVEKQIDVEEMKTVAAEAKKVDGKK